MIGFCGWMGPETTGFLGIPSGFNWQRRFLTSCPEYIRTPSICKTTVYPDKMVISSFRFFFFFFFFFKNVKSSVYILEMLF